MKSQWNPSEAEACGQKPLSLRVYTSRLLGREPSLVLHGGGNTSVKDEMKNLFGEHERLLYVKGSGWDLASIEAKGFAPVRMQTLLKMAELPTLSDTDMVRVQKSAMTDPGAPAPSVEAILHAIIPFRFVDHTHADAVVAITNTPRGEKTIREIYGDRVLYIPYVMPGFILARKVFEMTRDVDWKKYEGMVLLHHGIFTFSDDARESYERMIRFVSMAEDYLSSQGAWTAPAKNPLGASWNLEQLTELARLRRAVSSQAGHSMVACMDSSPEALGFAGRKDIESLTGRGPLTPDHVLHTKRTPLVLDSGDFSPRLEKFARSYRDYFEKNATPGLKCLDPSPRWAVWPGRGVLSFGVTAQRAQIVRDIARHTTRALQWAEALGGWTALPEKDIFEVEYWELEQAKLKKTASHPIHQGKVALVTGAASGIGKACVESLRRDGAAVMALDINPAIAGMWETPSVIGRVCDVTDGKALLDSVHEAIRQWGGLDIVVANAGLFPGSKTIDSIDDESWRKVMDVNLTSQMVLFRACAPFLVHGIDPSIVVIASKNVPAPGPGAAAYSASKAGLTQLARVAALELGPKGVRVQMLHPHAVMDTALWTPELLESRARNYKMSVDEYKRNNLLKVEVLSQDVADLASAMAGPLFSKTTGAQIAVDGGSDRII